MSTRSFQDDMQQKVDKIWRFVVWIVAYVISLALCLPGIFISIQYYTDVCVQQSGLINLLLDAWLFFACLFVQIYMLIILVFICFGARSKTFSIFWVFIHAIQVLWYIMGIYLIINSTLNCKHNSLWEMSLAYCVIMGCAWIAESLYMALKWSGCVNRCSCNICNICFDANEVTHYFINPISSQINNDVWDIDN